MIGKTDENKNVLVLWGRKKKERLNKKCKNENFEKHKLFLMSQGSFYPKIRFLGQKVRTDGQTDTHESEY